MSDAQAKLDHLSGKVKETAGEVTGDKDLKAEGKVQQGEAKIKEAVEDAGDKVKEAVEDAKAGLGALADRLKGDDK